MNVDMTYGEMILRHRILLDVGKIRLPRKISVAISRNIKTFEKEMEEFNKQREDIAKRYAKTGENGNFVIEDNSYEFENEDKKKSFIEESKELEDVSLTVNVLKFDESELEKCEDARYDVMTPLQEISLEWMIDTEDKKS